MKKLLSFIVLGSLVLLNSKVFSVSTGGDTISFTTLTNLSGPKVTDDSLKNLDKRLSENVKILNLSGSSITDEGLGYLKIFKSLTDLNLSNCRNITIQGLLDLLSVINLKSLNIKNCKQFTAADISKLKIVRSRMKITK